MLKNFWLEGIKQEESLRAILLLQKRLKMNNDNFPQWQKPIDDEIHSSLSDAIVAISADYTIP